MPTKQPIHPVHSETLYKTIRGGFDHPILRARLNYKKSTQILNHYMQHFTQCQVCGRRHKSEHGPSNTCYTPPERIYPTMLPTQASLRWSTTGPPLVNTPDTYRAITPDPSTYWLSFDLDAIEAKLTAAYSHDKADLEAFQQGYDIHTLTFCWVSKTPIPPDPATPHTAESCRQWREQLGWTGRSDRRRRLFKVVRYALIYGTDEHSIESAPEAEELGYTADELCSFGRQFLRLKPGLTAAKQRYRDEISLTREARTEFGNRRRFFGASAEAGRQGWNHMIQGWVAIAINRMLIAIVERCPYIGLVLNSHDGLTLAVNRSEPDPETLATVRAIVEQNWLIDGETIQSTATWGLTRPGTLGLTDPFSV